MATMPKINYQALEETLKGLEAEAKKKKPTAELPESELALGMQPARTETGLQLGPYPLTAAQSAAPIHKGTHLKPGVYDIGVNALARKYPNLTLEQVAEDLANRGFVVAIRRRGQPFFAGDQDHLHFADPILNPEEARRLAAQRLKGAKVLVPKPELLAREFSAAAAVDAARGKAANWNEKQAAMGVLMALIESNPKPVKEKPSPSIAQQIGRYFKAATAHAGLAVTSPGLKRPKGAEKTKLAAEAMELPAARGVAEGVARWLMPVPVVQTDFGGDERVADTVYYSLLGLEMLFGGPLVRGAGRIISKLAGRQLTKLGEGILLRTLAGSAKIRGTTLAQEAREVAEAARAAAQGLTTSRRAAEEARVAQRLTNVLKAAKRAGAVSEEAAKTAERSISALANTRRLMSQPMRKLSENLMRATGEELAQHVARSMLTAHRGVLVGDVLLDSLGERTLNRIEEGPPLPPVSDKLSDLPRIAEYSAMKTILGQYLADATSEGDWNRVARINAALASFPEAPYQRKIAEKGKQPGMVGALGAGWEMIKHAPQVIAEAIPIGFLTALRVAPGLLAQGYITPRDAGHFIATLTRGLLVGLNSFSAEKAGMFWQLAAENGVDLFNPQDVKRFVSDASLYTRLRNQSIKYAIPVALFDAASTVIAGAHLGAPGLKALDKVKAVARELGEQMFMGMAGQYTGFVFGDRPVDWADVLMEGAAELGSAPIEIASGIMGRGAHATWSLVQRAERALAERGMKMGTGVGAAATYSEAKPEKRYRRAIKVQPTPAVSTEAVPYSETRPPEARDPWIRFDNKPLYPVLLEDPRTYTSPTEDLSATKMAQTASILIQPVRHNAAWDDTELETMMRTHYEELEAYARPWSNDGGAQTYTRGVATTMYMLETLRGQPERDPASTGWLDYVEQGESSTMLALRARDLQERIRLQNDHVALPMIHASTAYALLGPFREQLKGKKVIIYGDITGEAAVAAATLGASDVTVAKTRTERGEEPGRPSVQEHTWGWVAYGAGEMALESVQRMWNTAKEKNEGWAELNVVDNVLEEGKQAGEGKAAVMLWKARPRGLTAMAAYHADIERAFAAGAKNLETNGVLMIMVPTGGPAQHHLHTLDAYTSNQFELIGYVPVQGMTHEDSSAAPTSYVTLVYRRKSSASEGRLYAVPAVSVADAIQKGYGANLPRDEVDRAAWENRVLTPNEALHYTASIMEEVARAHAEHSRGRTRATQAATGGPPTEAGVAPGGEEVAAGPGGLGPVPDVGAGAVGGRPGVALPGEVAERGAEVGAVPPGVERGPAGVSEPGVGAEALGAGGPAATTLGGGPNVPYPAGAATTGPEAVAAPSLQLPPGGGVRVEGSVPELPGYFAIWEQRGELRPGTRAGVSASYAPYEPRTTSLASPHPGARNVVTTTRYETSDILRSAYPTDDAVLEALRLPKGVIRSSGISDVQWDAVALAARTFSSYDPSVHKQGRPGFVLADGMGMGKTRTNLGIIMHARAKYRTKRILWLVPASEGALVQQMIQDYNEVRNNLPAKQRNRLLPPIITADQAADLSKYDEGILLVGYTWFAGEANNQRVIDWVREEETRAGGTPGLLIFDECHLAQAGEGSLRGEATIRIQEECRNSCVVYSSGTVATDAGDVQYMARLGLYGEGAPFATFEDLQAAAVAQPDILSEMTQRLARNGQMVARSLSMEEVDADRLVLGLDDQLAQALTTAVEILRRIESTFEGLVNQKYIPVIGKWQNTFRRMLYAGIQDACGRMYSAIKVRLIRDEIAADLEQGRQVVIQLSRTGETAMTAAEQAESPILSHPVAALIARIFSGQEMRINGGLVQYQWRHKTTNQEMWATRSAFAARPDQEHWEPVMSDVIQQVRDELLNAVRLNIADFSNAGVDITLNPIDAIHRMASELGYKSAEITGRTRRIDEQGNIVSRSAYNENNAAREGFQRGDVQVVVISDAGGLGVSLHDTNGHQRAHYVLEFGWNPKSEVQKLFRTHRTGQRSAPKQRVVSLTVAGEARFAENIIAAIRMMGAIAGGQAGQLATQDYASMDYETPLGLRTLIAALDRPGMEDIRTEMGSLGFDLREVQDVIDYGAETREWQVETVRSFFNKAQLLPARMQERLGYVLNEVTQEALEFLRQTGESPNDVITIEPVVSRVVLNQPLRNVPGEPATRLIIIDTLVGGPRDLPTPIEWTKWRMYPKFRTAVTKQVILPCLVTDEEGVPGILAPSLLRHGRYVLISADGLTRYLTVFEAAALVRNSRLQEVDTPLESNRIMEAGGHKQFDVSRRLLAVMVGPTPEQWSTWHVISPGGLPNWVTIQLPDGQEVRGQLLLPQHLPRLFAMFPHLMPAAADPYAVALWLCCGPVHTRVVRLKNGLRLVGLYNDVNSSQVMILDESGRPIGWTRNGMDVELRPDLAAVFAAANMDFSRLRMPHGELGGEAVFCAYLEAEDGSDAHLGLARLIRMIGIAQDNGLLSGSQAGTSACEAIKQAVRNDIRRQRRLIEQDRDCEVYGLLAMWPTDQRDSLVQFVDELVAEVWADAEEAVRQRVRTNILEGLAQRQLPGEAETFWRDYYASQRLAEEAGAEVQPAEQPLLYRPKPLPEEVLTRRPKRASEVAAEQQAGEGNLTWFLTPAPDERKNYDDEQFAPVQEVSVRPSDEEVAEVKKIIEPYVAEEFEDACRQAGMSATDARDYRAKCEADRLTNPPPELEQVTQPPAAGGYETSGTQADPEELSDAEADMYARRARAWFWGLCRSWPLPRLWGYRPRIPRFGEACKSPEEHWRGDAQHRRLKTFLNPFPRHPDLGDREVPTEQQIHEYINAWIVPVKEHGAAGRRGALGTYFGMEAVAEAKRPLDTQTVFHEMFHAIHDYIWGTQEPPFGPDGLGTRRSRVLRFWQMLCAPKTDVNACYHEGFAYLMSKHLYYGSVWAALLGTLGISDLPVPTSTQPPPGVNRRVWRNFVRAYQSFGAFRISELIQESEAVIDDFYRKLMEVGPVPDAMENPPSRYKVARWFIRRTTGEDIGAWEHPYNLFYHVNWVRTAWHRYQKASMSDKLSASIVDIEPKRRLRRMNLTDYLVKTIYTSLHPLYILAEWASARSSRYAPIGWQKIFGKTLPPEYNPGVVAQRALGSAGVAEMWIKEQPRDMVKGDPIWVPELQTFLPSLEQIYRSVPDRHTFEMYVVAKAAMDWEGARRRWRDEVPLDEDMKPIVPEPNWSEQPVPHLAWGDDPWANYRQWIAEFESKPENLVYMTAQQQLVHWHRMLTYHTLVINGLVSEDVYRLMTAVWPNYVPMDRRAMHDVEEQTVSSVTEGGGRAAVNLPPGIRHRKGGKHDILAPFSTAVHRAYKYAHLGALNQVGLALYTLAEYFPHLGDIVRKVGWEYQAHYTNIREILFPWELDVLTREANQRGRELQDWRVILLPETDAEAGIIYVFKDGQRIPLQVAGEIRAALEHLGPIHLGALENVLSIFTRFLRWCIVTSLNFIFLRNPQGDLGQALINSPMGIGFLDWIGAAIDVICNREWSKRYAAMGGLMTSQWTRDPRELHRIAQNTLRELELQRFMWRTGRLQALDFVLHPVAGMKYLFRGLKHLAERLDMIPRVAEFKKTLDAADIVLEEVIEEPGAVVARTVEGVVEELRRIHSQLTSEQDLRTDTPAHPAEPSQQATQDPQSPTGWAFAERRRIRLPNLRRLAIRRRFRDAWEYLRAWQKPSFRYRLRPATRQDAQSGALLIGNPDFNEPFTYGEGPQGMFVIEDVTNPLQPRRVPADEMPAVLFRARMGIAASEFLTNRALSLGAFSDIREAAAVFRTLMGAVVSGRRLTVDFADYGSWGRMLNALIAFFNAQLQGTRMFWGALRRRPVQTMTRIALYSMLPTIALYAWNRRFCYAASLPSRERDLYWHVCIPVPGGQPIVLRWRKPFDASPITAAAERMLDAVTLREPYPFEGFGSHLWDVWTPSWCPTLVYPLFLQFKNETWLGKPIVPPGDMWRPPEEQYGIGTTWFARWYVRTFPAQAARRVFPPSPRRYEALWRGYFGEWAHYAEQILGKAFSATGIGRDIPVPPKRYWHEELPVVNWLVQFGLQPDPSVDDFYKEYIDLRERRKALRQRGRDLTRLELKELRNLEAKEAALSGLRRVIDIANSAQSDLELSWLYLAGVPVDLKGDLATKKRQVIEWAQAEMACIAVAPATGGRVLYPSAPWWSKFDKEFSDISSRLRKRFELYKELGAP